MGKYIDESNTVSHNICFGRLKKVLYSFAKKLGILKIMPPQENQLAVNNFIDWLNRIYPPGPWIALTGFTALTAANPGTNNTATFNPNLGFLLKSFKNTSTGEVKSFDAHRFYA